MYRELLKSQLDLVARGEDPMEVYREPDRNQCIALPQEEAARVFFEREREMSTRMRYQGASDKHGPLRSAVIDLFAQAEAQAARGEPLLPPVEPPEYPVGYMEHRNAVLIP